MARFWTRKNEDYTKEEDTLQAEDFLSRVARLKEKDRPAEKPKIENTK